MADQGLESSFVMSGLVTPFLEGSISAPTVKEVEGPITQMVIRKDQDWEIEVNWEVHGSLLSNPTSASFPFTGNWLVRAYLESIGPGTEYTLPTDGLKISVDKTTTADRRDYSATIEVAKGKVEAGVYKLVVAVTHESSPGVPGPIAGFYEGGVLQIYETN